MMTTNDWDWLLLGRKKISKKIQNFGSRQVLYNWCWQSNFKGWKKCVELDQSWSDKRQHSKELAVDPLTSHGRNVTLHRVLTFCSGRLPSSIRELSKKWMVDPAPSHKCQARVHFPPELFCDCCHAASTNCLLITTQQKPNLRGHVANKTKSAAQHYSPTNLYLQPKTHQIAKRICLQLCSGKNVACLLQIRIIYLEHEKAAFAQLSDKCSSTNDSIFQLIL